MLADQAHFLTLLKARSGIEITAQKAYLVEARLAGVAARHGCPSVPALLGAIRANPASPLADDAVDAMTTNETLFFRDGAPFADLAALLRAAGREKRSAPFRIWSAACATGQEPYSIAMTAAETQPSPPVDILATDISENCLAAARIGEYSDFEVRRGLSPARLDKHFEPVGGQWRVRERVRRVIRWRRHNLLESLAHGSRYDVVFCRNVLIYFDLSTRAAVLAEIARHMVPGGTLYLGGAETTIGMCAEFRPQPGGAGGYLRC